MASLQSYKGKPKTDSDGKPILDRKGNTIAPTLWRLQFIPPDKRRRTVYLGEIAEKDANTIKRHTEAIVSGIFAKNPPPDETARWLTSLDAALYEKLAAVGLATPRASATLDAFIGEYIAKRKDVKPRTALVWKHTRANLVEFFGADKPLKEITVGDAADWRRWLTSAKELSKHGEPSGRHRKTVFRRCGRS